MRCSRSARVGSALRAASLLALALSWLTAATVVEAQSARRASSRESAGEGASGGSEKADNMKMPSTSIEGERQTPDIFFVFPTGKGGNLSMPHLRDYGPDILDPVVKPWFEREQALGPSQIQEVVTSRSSDWKEALKSPPPPAPAPAAEPPPRPVVPPPAIPSQALAMPAAPPPLPPPGANPPAYRPPAAYDAPAASRPTPQPAPPPPPQPPSYQGVPVLAPRPVAPPPANASNEVGPPGYRPPSPDQLRAVGQ